MSQIKSPAKQMVVEFLQATREKAEFRFEIAGSEEEAKRFVHRMRVELSRMREAVRELGKVPKDFKMLLEDVRYVRDAHKCIVKLKKQEGKTEHVAAIVDEIFDDIAGGEIMR